MIIHDCWVEDDHQSFYWKRREKADHTLLFEPSFGRQNWVFDEDGGLFVVVHQVPFDITQKYRHRVKEQAERVRNSLVCQKGQLAGRRKNGPEKTDHFQGQIGVTDFTVRIERGIE